MQPRIPYDLKRLGGDLLGGVTAAVVALPTALAFGLASGIGPEAGLYSAIAVGFFAAVFGGTPSQISGPTGPMTVAMAVVVTQHAGNIAEAFSIVMLAGLLQILLGALRIGSFVSYTPYSVISGFMSGVGAIIIVIHVLPLLGAPVVSGGPVAAILAWPAAAADLNADALIVGAVALAVAFFWPRRVRRSLPAPLAALIAGTLAAVIWFPGAPVIGPMPAGLPSLHAPVLSPAFLLGALQPAFILALLGSIDSLLTSLIADALTRTQHDANRELVGQGLGNIAAGAIGALPGAGATMGTVVNIQAGGRSAVSGAVRAGLLLVVVLAAGQITAPIPHAVLAGILLKVGVDIVDWRFLTRLRRIQRDYVAVMSMTLLVTVFVDLVSAVALGMIVSALLHARKFERLEIKQVVSVPLLDTTFLADAADGNDAAGPADRYAARVGLVSLRGSFTVASAHEMARVIGADIREHEVVILDFSKTTYMDDSAADVAAQLVDAAAESDTDCIILGLSGAVADVLHSLDVFKAIPDERFVDSLDAARTLARTVVDRTAPAAERN